MSTKLVTFLCKVEKQAEKEKEELKNKLKIIVFNNDGIQKINKGDLMEMKNIIKRKDGRWQGRKVVNKKRIYVYAKTQAECYEKLKKFDTTKDNSKPSIKLIDFCYKWLKLYKTNISEESKKIYANCIKNHIYKIDKPINKVSLEDLQIFCSQLPNTRIKEYCILTIKQVFRKATELKIIKENISIYIEKGKIEKSKVDWYNLEQQEKILNNLSNNKYDFMIKTFLLTGARPSELKSIEHENIKKGYVLIKGTKNKNAIRWVKISDKFEKELLNFTEQQNNFKYSLKRFQKYFNEFTTKLDIKGTVYMLRHTFATNLFYLGVPDKERQSYMGHASTQITNDIYTTFDPTISKEDILRIYNNLYPNFIR